MAEIISLEECRQRKEDETDQCDFDPSKFCGKGTAGFEYLLSCVTGQQIKIVPVKLAHERSDNK